MEINNINKKSPILEYYKPKNRFIGIVSIPHSGENIPDEFLPFLTNIEKDLLQDVDYRVHELVDIKELQENGIAVIKSNISRVAIDLNRSKELALLNWKNNSKGKKIVISEPSEDKSFELLETYYSPYFDIINTLCKELLGKMSIASFIDLHSMPGVAEDYHMKINPTQEKIRPDFCISNINMDKGSSCERDFINNICDELQRSYSKVNINNPYFGGHITRYINDSISSINNIQIEINRSLYMDEETKILKNNKELIKNLTHGIIQQMEKYYLKYKIN